MDKESFRNKSANTINRATPYLTRTYLEFCFTHSVEQIITEPTWETDQTATLIDYILTNSPDKVSQSGVIDLGLSHHDLIYCTKKYHYPNPINIMIFFSLKEKVFHQKLFGKSKRDFFPNYLNYTCVNDAYPYFINRFVESINFIAPAKRIRVKANSKSCFNNQIMSAKQRRDKLYKNFKDSGL